VRTAQRPLQQDHTTRSQQRAAPRSALPDQPTIPGVRVQVSPAQRRTLVQRLRMPAALFVLVSSAALYLGWRVIPLSRYITPERGIGYALGIAGGSLMLLLLLYPARKRVRWLSFMGSVKAWFRLHMVLGIVGPILVLYHANFSFGAANSNVALVCMLVVSGSGLIGRYFYTKIHEGLYGHQSNLMELQQRAARLRQVSLSTPLLTELLKQLDCEEDWLLSRASRKMLLVRPLYAAWASLLARRRLRRIVRRATKSTDRASRKRLRAIARGYILTRMGATRRVAEYQAYVSLFSWWHVLHLPLFFLLLIAGTVHVVAVHVY
jgi:hypothetical protein